MNYSELTERQQQYLVVQRAFDDPHFPIPGYYFIRGVRFKKDDNGNNLFPYASVNWKLNEDDAWHDYDPNRFIIRLDYLFGDFSLKPQIPTDELKHHVIHIKSIVVDQKQHSPLNFSRIYADWEISDFVDLLDSIPYFNLLNPIVLAAAEYQYELEELNMLAIEYDEMILNSDLNEFNDDQEDDVEYDENPIPTN